MIVTVDNVGALGISQDAYSPELPVNAWTDAQNVKFREGYAEKMRGHVTPFGTPTVAPYHVQPYTTGAGARYWIYAGLNKVYYVDNTGTHTNITRQTTGVDVDYAATADQRWNGGTLAGYAILNNGVDVPQTWAGTGKCANLSAITGWASNTTCKVARTFREYILALNVTKGSTNYPHMVKWSSAAEPGTLPSTFDHTDVTQDAGEQDLYADPSPIVDGLALSDQFYIYKEQSYWRVAFVGVPQVFSFDRVGTVGALGPNCVAEYPGGHIVLGQGDVFVHAGGAPTSIIDKVARRWLFADLDDSTYVRSFVAANPLQNEAWICVVPYGETAPIRALIWNWSTNTFTKRELPSVAHAASGTIDSATADTWDSDPEPWDSDTTYWNQAPDITKSAPRFLMASPANTALYLADQSRTFNGDAITAYVQREGVSFGNPKSVKLLKRIIPVFDAPDGTEIQIRTGATMSQASGTAWGDYQTFTVGTDVELYSYSLGRYLAWEFKTASLTSSWRIKRYDIEYDERGYY